MMGKNLKGVMAILVIWLLLAPMPAMAEELSLRGTLEKIPALKQGIAYSVVDHGINYLSTLEVANWKGIAFEVGYSSKDKLVGVVSYELLKLKDLGVTLPLLDLIEFRVGLYGGFEEVALGLGNGKGNNEFDCGLSATLISVKF